MTVVCDCQGLSGGEYHCRRPKELGLRVCDCHYECCNTGWHADDGDGYVDFMPERDNCQCKKPEMERDM